MTIPLAGLVERGDYQAVRDAMPMALAWVRLLPDHAVDTLTEEYLETVHTASLIEDVTPVFALLAEWRHAAEIYAEPERYAGLIPEYLRHLTADPVPSR